jgi:hypothetical protein
VLPAFFARLCSLYHVTIEYTDEGKACSDRKASNPPQKVKVGCRNHITHTDQDFFLPVDTGFCLEGFVVELGERYTITTEALA